MVQTNISKDYVIPIPTTLPDLATLFLMLYVAWADAFEFQNSNLSPCHKALKREFSNLEAFYGIDYLLIA